MDTGGYLVRAIAMIVLVLIFVAIINFFIPFIMKAKLIEIGREYSNLMELNNGLSVIEKSDIASELTTKGFENVVVIASVQGTVSFKEPLVLEIVADYPIRQFGVFSSSQYIVPMNYKQTINSRRIEE